jgi:hypothetical protein
MRLHCEACQAALRAEDVRFDLALAKCHMCGAVYDFASRQTRGAPTEAPRGLAPIRPRAARPVRLHEEENDQGTVLSWRWFGAKHVFTALGCLIWDGVVLVFLSMVLMSRAPLVSLLFILPHLSAGLFLTYRSLAGLLNTTRVEVRQRELTIRHGPLPWPGNRTVSGHELTQLYCQKGRVKVWGNIKFVLPSSGNESYSLLAIDRQGRQVKLLSGIEDMDMVLYLELALERRLGIEDSPVAGELAERVRVE